MRLPNPFRKRRTPASAADVDAWLAANTYLVGGLPVPTRLAEFDFVVSGGKGTGKTTAMKAMMTSHVDAMIASKQKFNMHCYTPKPDDFYPMLKQLYEPLGVKVIATNPFMEESWAWDGAGTLSDPVRIDELVNVAIKEDQNDSNPFFKKATKLVVRGVIQSLAATHPGLWTMRHVVNCLKEMELAVQVLDRYEPTQYVSSLLASDQGRAAANLKATILTELVRLELVASLIDKTPDDRLYSIEQAAHEPGVIWVWGSDPRFNTLVEPWNAIQLELLGHELLIRGDIGVETLLYIDEFPQLSAGGGQKLAMITKLLEYGRSSRVRSTLAVQTPAQVVSVYGEKEAATLLGQCHGFMAFGHADEFGQKYWSARLGRERGFEKKRGYGVTEGGGATTGQQPSQNTNWSLSENVSIERFDLERVSPSEIGDLPVGTYEFGMHGYASVPLSLHRDPATGAPMPIRWRFHLTPDWIARNVPRTHKFRPYARGLKPTEAYALKPLETWEYGFLGLTRPGPPRKSGRR